MNLLKVKNIENNATQKLIHEDFKVIENFTVKYQLLVTHQENNKSFDLILTKYKDGISIEKAELKHFTSSKKEALKIFNQLTNGSVTPMCLDDCVLELL